MTEMTAKSGSLPRAIERFVLQWGEMGERWGVNRSVAQIHALLYTSAAPLTAEDIAGQLGLARSNVSTSLKELQSWSLVRRVHLLGDRRDHFEAEADMMEMVRRIALGRMSREITPALDVLRAVAADAASDRSVSIKARERISAMLTFVEASDRAFGEIMSLPSPVLWRLMKMGGAIARFAGAARPRPSRREAV